MKNKNLSYQTNAINFAINHLQTNKEFKLQSPTGSGKTFIISKLIDQYLENDILNAYNTTFIFIAPSTGKLDYQGYEKINSYINKNWVSGFSAEYIGTSNSKSPKKEYLSNIDYFQNRKVYFIGWQMFKKGTKISEINSEKNDIYRVINNTKNKGINIVLIIDEAHREIKSTNEYFSIKQNIINEMDPYKIIKVSATLEQVNEKPDYKISYEDVRDESAIKKNIIICDIDNNNMTENEQLIMAAIKKQNEIKEAYLKNKIDINPLILIQIPDNYIVEKNINNEEILLSEIKNILAKYDYKEGYNYALWLSNNKTIAEKEKIIDKKSPIDILIFKTAIATGWDIPRANILVRIREPKTKAFNIQTLGRILRNPFFKYYENELIDNAFVFTKDEKYAEYIKQENIVSYEKDFKNVKRSSKAINSTFIIDKKIIKHEINKEEMINEITQIILKDDKFKNEFLNYEHDCTKNSTIKISSKLIIDNNIDDINKKIDKEQNIQLKLNYHQPKINLFDLYIKYKTITKSNELINQILNNIENKIHLFNKKIKDFYWACIYNWNNSFWTIDNNNLTLLERINYEKNKYLKDNVIYEYHPYVLPNEYKVNLNHYDCKWDELNTFDVTLKSYESDNEKLFYKNMLSAYSDNDNIHIFRNGVGVNDYYIEYINSENKISKFYPDFILIDEKDKTYIIYEAKGRNSQTNIDNQIEYKMKAMKYSTFNEITDSQNRYKPKNDNYFFKVSNNKENLEFSNGKDVLTFTNMKKIIKSS